MNDQSWVFKSEFWIYWLFCGSLLRYHGINSSHGVENVDNYSIKAGGSQIINALDVNVIMLGYQESTSLHAYLAIFWPRMEFFSACDPKRIFYHIVRLIKMLGGPKNDKNQKHANHGDNTGISREQGPLWWF